MKCIQKTGADKNNSLERKIDLTLYFFLFIYSKQSVNYSRKPKHTFTALEDP